MAAKKKASTPAGTERQMERIMDKLQSLQITAGYSDAPASALRAVYEYARTNIPIIQKLRRDLKTSDEPWRADGSGIRNTRGGYEWSLKQIVHSPRYSNAYLSRRVQTNKRIGTTLKRVHHGTGRLSFKGDKVVLQQYAVRRGLHGQSRPVGRVGGTSRDRGNGVFGSKPGSHFYRLNIQPLEKEPHEHVELYRTSGPLAASWNGGYVAIAYRYGQELVRFIPTRPILKRLMNEIPGKITITKEMVDRARLIASSSGR
jgi:hypothetical protein